MFVYLWSGTISKRLWYAKSCQNDTSFTATSSRSWRGSWQPCFSARSPCWTRFWTMWKVKDNGTQLGPPHLDMKSSTCCTVATLLPSGGKMKMSIGISYRKSVNLTSPFVVDNKIAKLKSHKDRSNHECVNRVIKNAWNIKLIKCIECKYVCHLKYYLK